MATRATFFSPICGIEATLPIEFDIPLLRVAIESRLTDSQSLKNRLSSLEELDERHRMNAQHIEAIQYRRKIIFYKQHKKCSLRSGMLILLQYPRELVFPDKFDAVWLGPYLVCKVYPNNFVQLETLNGSCFPTSKRFGVLPLMVANYVSPRKCPNVQLT